jgi:hypothetical protein
MRTGPKNPVRRGGIVKVLVISLVVALVLLGLVLAMLPRVIGGMLPGMVSSRGSGIVAGQVTLDGASLSWGGPQRLTGLRLRGPAAAGGSPGDEVANLNLSLDKGLLGLLNLTDLGTLTVSGQVTLSRGPDGATNLQQATAPAPGTTTTTTTATGSEPLLPLRAALKIDGLDITYRELDAAGKAVREAGIRQLKGGAAVDLAAAGGVATADLSASVSDGAASSPLSIKADLKQFIGGDRRPAPQAARGTLAIQAEALPTALIDALANQNGVLAGAIGPKLKLDVQAQTEGTGGVLNALAQGENLDASLGLTLKDNRLRAASGSRVLLKSTAFAAGLPAVRDGLSRAGVTLEGWPEASIELAALDVPAEGKPAAELDLRKSGLEARVRVGAVRGRIAGEGDAAGGVGGVGGAGGGRAFGLEPLSLSVAAADLAGPVTIQGSTQASLDGQPAGRLMADVRAEGLLDEGGRLTALEGGTPGSVSGRIEAAGISAGVLQPVLAGVGVPVNVREDVGPTLDVGADIRQTADGLDVDARVQAEHMRAAAPVRLAQGTLTSRGPITLSMPASAGLLNGLLARGGETPAVTLSGRGGVEASIRELSVSTGAFDLAKLTLAGEARVSDLTARTRDGTEVTLRGLAAELSAKPGQALGVKARAEAEHAGKGFDLSADARVSGLPEGLKAGQVVPGVGPVRVEGTAEARNAPTALAKMAAGDSPIVAELIRGLLGEAVSASVQLAGAGPSQRAGVRVNAANLTTGIDAELSGTQITVAAIEAEATVRPDTAQALLRAAGQSEQAVAGVRMQQPARLAVKVSPVTIPVQVVSGRPTPMLDRLEKLDLTARLLDPVLVSGIPAGGRTLTGGVSGLTLDASVPGAVLSGQPSGQRLSAKARGEVMLDAGRRVASLAATADAASDLSALDASVGLTGIDTAAADGLLGEPGYVSGALGESAQLTLTAKRTGKDAPIATTIELASPGLSTGSVGVSLGADRVSLAGPARVQWTVQPAWAERFLLAGKDAQGRATPATLRLTKPARVELDVQRLALALPSSGPDGQPASGPMKPGVFALQASGRIDALSLQPLTRDQRGQLVINSDAVTLSAITLGLSSEEAAGGAGGGGAGVALQAGIGELSQGGVTVPKPMTVSGRVRGLADARGVIAAAGGAGAVIDLDVTGEKVPVVVIDQLAGLNGQGVSTIGSTMAMSVKLAGVSRGAAGAGTADVRVNGRGLPAMPATRSRPAMAGDPNAEVSSLTLGGPVREGVLDLSAGSNPLNLRLTQFRYDVNAKLLKMFPLFASASKSAWTGPAPAPPGRGPLVIASRDLRVPLDGDMRRLNGRVDVDIGVIDYTFREALGEFLDSTLFTGGVDQRPIQPFAVNIVNGVATYDKFEIPVRNFFIKSRGTVDLVNNTVDVITYIPTVAASKGLVTKLNEGAAKGVGKVLPDVLSESTMIPLRARGPLDNPKYEIDFDLFFKEFGDQLIKQPGKIIEGVLDGLLKPKGR